MYPVSAAYRHAMRRQVRDQGYVRLQFGIFDASAPGDAAVTVPPGTWYSDVSVLDGGESPVRVSYATFEWDRMRLDGTQRLLPESGAELAAQGFVSAALCGADGVFASPPVVSVAFGTVHSMAGLTLDFGDCSKSSRHVFSMRFQSSAPGGGWLPRHCFTGSMSGGRNVFAAMASRFASSASMVEAYP